MKAINNLVEATRSKRVGNHNVRIADTIRFFGYHDNTVCVAYDNLKVFSLDDCGWAGKPSTTRTLNEYRNYFTSLGYTEVK